MGLARDSDWVHMYVFDPLTYKTRPRHEVRALCSYVETVVQFLWLKGWGKNGGQANIRQCREKKDFRRSLKLINLTSYRNRHRTSLYIFF